MRRASLAIQDTVVQQLRLCNFCGNRVWGLARAAQHAAVCKMNMSSQKSGLLLHDNVMTKACCMGCEVM